MIKSLSSIIVNRPWFFVLLSVVVSVGLGFGTKNLSFRSDYKIYFSESDPQRIAFEAVQDSYTPNDNILIVLHSEGKDITNSSLLEAVDIATRNAWELPFSSRVDSITNYQHTFVVGDDLVVENLIQNPQSLDAEQRQEALTIAVNEPALVNRLISPDGDTLGVNINFLLPEDPQEAQSALEEIAVEVRQIASAIRQEFPSLEVALTGILMQNRAFSEASQADSKTLYPLMLLVVAGVSLLALRSFQAAILASLVIILSATVALGIWGWLGLSMNNSSFVAPIIILTVAVADSIHILSVALLNLRQGEPWKIALQQSLNINFSAVALTTLTTIIGYASLGFSEAPPIQELGYLTAIGVAAAWFFSIMFLPAVAALLPFKSKVRTRATSTNRLQASVTAISKFRFVILVLFLSGALVAGYSARQIELNDDFVKYFDDSIEFRRDTDFATEHLSGPYILQFSLESGESSGITRPSYLKEVEQFKDWLTEQPEVTHVLAITDVIKRLNRVMNANHPDEYRIPESRNLIAQYLLLYELSLPYGRDLNNQINMDKSATRLSVTLTPLQSREMREFAERAEQWLVDNVSPAMQTKAVGPILMFAHISKSNIEAMTLGNTVAIVLIFFTILIFLRSFRFGVLGLVVNFLPILFTLGVWGATVGEIGMASSIMTATSLGIIIDFAIHVLVKFRRAMADGEVTQQEAVRKTLAMVSGPLLSTTVILLAGFGLLFGSAFLVNKHMGLLTAITVAFALLTDLLLLPALLLFKNPGASARVEEPNS